MSNEQRIQHPIKASLKTMTILRHIQRHFTLLSICSCLVVVGTTGFVAIDPVIRRNALENEAIYLQPTRRRRQVPLPLFSLSQQQEPSSSSTFSLFPPSSLLKDVVTLCGYMFSCLLVAVGVSLYQDYDVSTIKPQGPLRSQALYGMAYSNVNDETENSIHPAYNDVMQRHRDYRIKMWKREEATSSLSHDNAVATLVQALQSIQQLKILANNYEWDEMQSLIRTPLFTTKLEEACSVLRKTATTPEARDEIGFDWGR